MSLQIKDEERQMERERERKGGGKEGPRLREILERKIFGF